MASEPPFNSSYAFEDMNADIGGMLQMVEIYEPSAGPYYLQKVLRNAWSSMNLGAGHAYMVRVSNDVKWMVPEY